MDDPNRTGLPVEESIEEEKDTGEYAFLKETVKNRPLSGRRIASILLVVACAAVVFGLIAGCILRAMVPTTQPDQVAFEKDEEPTPTPTPTPAPTPSATPTPTPSPSPEPDEESEEEPEEEEMEEPPELTEEEKIAQTIHDYSQIYAAMQSIAEEPERAIVTVIGVTRNEDWFNTINESTTTASGLIIAQLTNSYVILTDVRTIPENGRIVVQWADGTVSDAELTRQDANTELAVVTVPIREVPETVSANLAVAELGNSYTLSKGQPVIAIGQPMGNADSIDFGEITSLRNRIYLTDSYYPLISTNIGGAEDGSGILIDLSGSVIGIIRQSFSPSGNATITAIPISPLKHLIEQLSNNEAICYVGISGEDVGATLSAQTDIPQGIYITNVEAESPAFYAGIQITDVIVAIDGEPVDTLNTYQSMLESHTPGDEIEMTIARQGADGYVEMNVSLVIGELE